jgi:hypothetical protein
MPPESGADCFDGLDSIDWKSLTHAYGSAADIPKLLRATITDDFDQFGKAYSDLVNAINHQGTVYQATSYAVPFLINLINCQNGYEKRPEAPSYKALILYVLHNMAAGGSPWRQRIHSPESRTIFDSWVTEARVAVCKGTPVYQPLLNDPDPEIRLVVSEILSSCAQEMEDAAQAVRKAILAERDLSIKAEMIVSLSALAGKHIPSLDGFLLDFLEKSNPGPVRFAAAVSLAKIVGNHVPPMAQSILIECFADETLYIPYFSSMADYTPSLEDVCRIIYEFGPSQGVPMLLQALAISPQKTMKTTIIPFLLQLVFQLPSFDPRDNSYSQTPTGQSKIIYTRKVANSSKMVQGLNDEQKQVVSAIIQTEEFWQIETNLLGVFGLPTSRDKLRELLIVSNAPG